MTKHTPATAIPSIIPANQMLVGVRYVVTRASADNEFQVGDIIELTSSGCLKNLNANGWIDPDDVFAATRNMRVAIHK